MLASFALMLVATSAVHPAADKLRVDVTLPDLADITREIGGDRVDVTSLYKGRENTHA
jgi:ABC-type Zn uptake system ZnuABC Zn-binding protein ZnuA